MVCIWYNKLTWRKKLNQFFLTVVVWYARLVYGVLGLYLCKFTQLNTGALIE